MSSKYVVIDLETTGNTPKKGDKILQFAAVVVENGKIIEEYSSFVNPGLSIPPFIEELTGINDEMVKDAPSFSEIAPKVLTLLDGGYFVAHNVLFDLSFLQEELIEAGYNGFYGPILDTVEMARVLFPTADSFQLSELALREGLFHERPHQADSDALVTAELLLLLLAKLEQLPLQTVKQLFKLSSGLKSDLHLLLDEIVIKKEAKIEPTFEGLEIYRGIALRRNDETEKPLHKNTVLYPLEHEEKEKLFKKAFPAYEKRLGQFTMMDSVYHALTNQQKVMIEAGTGVGKSLAYLIPALIFGKEKNEPIIVSTYTIQLQEQLLSNDIPKLKKMIPISLSAVLLKGRSHYLSLPKFEQSLRNNDDNYDTILTKMQILVWLTETVTGDIDEVNLSSGGMLFWNKIKNDETIFGQNKSWVSRDFYLRARKKAATADIIITNHSLVLTDLIADNKILPTYHHIVIDEGHHFSQAASKHAGITFDYVSLRYLLSQIGLMDQKHLFYQLEKVIEKLVLEETKLLHSFEVNQMLIDLFQEMDDLFKTIAIYVKKMSSMRKGINRINFRVPKEDTSASWKAVMITAERFLFVLKDIINEFNNRLAVVSEKTTNASLTAWDKSIIEELAPLLQELNEVALNVKTIFLQPAPNFVKWIEVDTRSLQNSTTVYAQPVSVAEFLKEKFFQKKDSIILTSATLSVKNSFQYMMNELGINAMDCKTEQIESPFQYDKQVKLIIPEDLPEINAVSIDEYVAAIAEHIISIAEATKGRMLVLFTSHEMLKKTYEIIKESGFLDDFALIAQGISSGSRSRLTRNFQRFEKAILFGTSSFWEGIDIPGEDLSCLIIVRLPFSPPDEPLTEAKCERIKNNGGNPFQDYSLPEAVIRFKQGFGRLIRTKSDRGIIFIFDRRLVTTRYGKAFLQSIPQVPVENRNIGEIVEMIKKWL